MARTESIAVGGYWPTPDHIVRDIATWVDCSCSDTSGYYTGTVLDPCCGDGAAMRMFATSVHAKLSFYGIEMEATRAEAAIKSAFNRVTHGDAFCVHWTARENVQCLYLNPPYDQDRQHRRLEEKFLFRFTQILQASGILVFIVPATSLAASADTLSTWYRDLRCFRFPDGDFEAFGQVVLFASRAVVPSRDASIYDQVQRWSQAGADLPVLQASPEAQYRIPQGPSYLSLTLVDFDVKSATEHHRPYEHRDAIVRDFLPDSLDHILLRSYPVATPPRPAHVAAGIAAGVFNGARIVADRPGLPPLLVKGSFDREFRIIEEKTNKQGETTGYVQVQQPKLTVTVLDLDRHTYRSLPTTGPAEPTTVDELSIPSLLSQYGTSLMENMERQCPIGWDPRVQPAYDLPSSPRSMFRAQANAVRSLVHVLGGAGVPIRKRRGRSALLLGELGSGKTICAIQTARACGSRRALVVCPPHLLQSWQNEVAAVAPDIRTVVLEDPADVDGLVSDRRPCIAILSRERAKLSHGWADMGGPTCPRCGFPAPMADRAKKRKRCEHRRLIANDYIAQTGLQLLRYLARVMPDSGFVERLDSVMDVRRRALPPAPYVAGGHGLDLRPLLDLLADSGIELPQFLHVLVGLGDESLIRHVFFRELAKETGYDRLRAFGVLLNPNDSDVNEALTSRLTSSYGYREHDAISARAESAEHGMVLYGFGSVRWTDNVRTIEGAKSDILNFEAAVGIICQVGDFRRGRPCGEPLFQAVPEPRRVALAPYIQRRYPDLFDFLVVDECHEMSSASGDSAQERSVNRLQSLRLPTIRMTGTIMNGYADSMFGTMWATSPEFREEFAYDDRSVFTDRYGYRKQLVTVSGESEAAAIMAHGSNSDRVIRQGRTIGSAPGVLPLFVLRHLLRYAVTLHKSDLALDLPELTQHQVEICPTEQQARKFSSIRDQLVTRMRWDRYQPDVSGRLLGQLSELPSYMDRMTRDTGNAEHGRWEVRYPESVGGDLVCSEEPLESLDPLPKEQWMIDTVKAELAEGRNVMILGWHISCLPRLSRLLKTHTGFEAPVLFADRVAAAKRQAWIDKEIVRPGRRILVCNPVAIQTGLNNLVHFATQIWMENPACNPNVFRQAVGRIDRIGQKLPTRVFVPVYKDSMQVQLQDLLARKIAVAVATDGQDPESALSAAGVTDDTFMAALSIGKYLWDMFDA